MEVIISNLGDNRVSQCIATNMYEQTTEYQYNKPVECLYEDLFKKRSRSVSTTSLQSISSNKNVCDIEFVKFGEDSFVYLMYYIKDPSISLSSKDVIPRNLKDFRNALANDDKTFAIKKMSKLSKQKIMNTLLSSEPIRQVDEALLSYFSHYLKANIILLKSDSIIKSCICIEDNFDTVIIDDKRDKGLYKMVMVSNNYSLSWKEAKDYMFSHGIYDKTILDTLNAVEMRALAQKLNIPVVKEVEGKKHKVLKDDLRMLIANKI